MKSHELSPKEKSETIGAFSSKLIANSKGVSEYDLNFDTDSVLFPKNDLNQHFDYTVLESIVYPHNKVPLVERVIAGFLQANEAVKFAKRQAKERRAYDNKSSFQYSVMVGGKIMNRYYNNELLHK